MTSAVELADKSNTQLRQVTRMRAPNLHYFLNNPEMTFTTAEEAFMLKTSAGFGGLSRGSGVGLYQEADGPQKDLGNSFG